MILVLAAGVGLGVIRHNLPTLFARWETGGGWATPIVLNRIAALQPCLMVWTLAWLILRLRPPRPRLRRLASQPGFVACAAASTVAATGGLLTLLIARLNFHGGDPYMESMAWHEVASPQIGQAVVASWAVLALGGRWRAEPEWLDRAGRAIGLCWIALIPADLILIFWYNAWM